MAVTLHKATGFEHGSVVGGAAGPFDSASSGTPTIVTTGQRSGLRALQLNPAGAAESVILASAGTVVTVALFIKFTTLPTTAGDPFVRIRNTNGNALLEWDQTNQKFRVDMGAAAPVVGGPVITTGQWYRVVMELDTSTGTATIRCKVDSTTEFSQSNAQTSLASQDVTLGPSGVSTYDALFDDLVISITDGDYEQIRDDWTDWEILSAIPTSDGTHEATNASGDFDGFTTPTFTQTSTNVNANIGHRPLQLANTANNVVRQSVQSATKYVEVLFENPSNTHPNVAGVQTYGTMLMSSATGTPTAEARLMLSDSTEVLTTGGGSLIDTADGDPGTTVTVRKKAAIAPAGGWDETKVDGLKCRFGFNNIAADAHFVDLMLEVVYFATGAAPAADALFHHAGRSIYV